MMMAGTPCDDAWQRFANYRAFFGTETVFPIQHIDHRSHDIIVPDEVAAAPLVLLS